ncbi:MAG: prolyl oligopeptidase family serine peptidase [Pseudomonadota bacterium]|jgi:dipeptidyl aminopeptidase/acylaminoacyl peptidase
MFKKVSITLGILLLLFAALLLPSLFTEKSPPGLVGPNLSSLAYKEVAFTNGDLSLAGMLFVPEGDGPFPAVVVIQGSGPSRRTNKWYLSVARYLQENGIAVLLHDKRGSERSGGSWIGADFETLAGDTLAAVDYIRSQELFPYVGIGLVGMSQGGWIAPVAASRDGDIDFVVSMSGSSVPVWRQLVHEEIHNISHYTWPFLARLLAPLTAKRIMKMDHVRPYAGFDPIPYWMKVKAPVFFAFGENDENTPVKESVAVLKQDLDVDLIKVYPEGGHAIRDKITNGVQKQFLHDLVRFIKDTNPQSG